MKGLFITFEGPDGAGKTTQIKHLKEYLQSVKKSVILTREPGGTELSELIREILLDARHTEMDYRTELLLYAAARAQHVHELILPALNQGKIVICDRFADSTLAYQGFGRGIDLDLIEKINSIATSGVEPDLTILLDIDVCKGLQRVNTSRGRAIDRLEAEKLDFHEKVRQGFLSLSQKKPARVKLVQADRPEYEVAQEITKHISTLIGD